MFTTVKIMMLVSLPLLDPSPAFGFGVRTPLPPPIVACPSTAEVQRAIDACVTAGDAVLELGAQLSDTSARLCRAVGSDGRAVLADVKRKEATSGRSRGRDVAPFLGGGPPRTPSHANVARESFVDRVEYHELERYEEWRALVKGGRQFDVIILDVASTIGNDLHLSALSIANEFIASQRNLRSVVVKSKVLSKLSRRIIHSQRLLDGTVALPAKDELDGYPDPLIIPCVGVNDYRNTIPYVVDQGDEVIEVGCHYGTTTSLLYDASVTKEGLGFCGGVDIGEKIVQSARRRYPEITFEVVDAWNTLDLLKVKRQHCGRDSSLGYDVVYADIGGLSGASGLLESLALLDAIGKALEPRCIVIKSLCMKRLASQLTPLANLKRGTIDIARNGL